MKEKEKNLTKMLFQVNDTLSRMCRFSESKKLAKIAHRKDPDVISGKKSIFCGEINSYGTFHKYRDICFTFIRWCVRQYPDISSYKSCRQLVGKYLKYFHKDGKAIKTTSNYRVGLVKLYGFVPYDFSIIKIYGFSVSVDDFIKYRYASKDDIRWFQYEVLTIFIVCTGLRKNEVRNLRAGCLKKIGEEYYLYLTVGAKNGKPRYAKIIGTNEEKAIILNLMNKSPEEKIFSQTPDDFPYHKLRSIYACRYIDMCATVTADTPKEIIYCFRGSLKEYCFSRTGMKEISNSLGYERIGVIKNYFRKFLYQKTTGKTGMEIIKEVYDLMQSGMKFE